MTRQLSNPLANTPTRALLAGAAALILAAVCSAADNQIPCVADLYAFQKDGTASGRTEVMIVNGADRYRSVLLHSATALREIGFDRSWDLLLGDFNGDAVPDLYAIQKKGTRSGQTEVHILNGADFFRSLLLHGARTPISETGEDGAWDFALADFNGDRVLDLYVIHKQGTPSGQTEVHILNGADHFRAYLVLGAKTALSELGRDASWEFALADFSGDRVPDLYAIEKKGSRSGQTEVHILGVPDLYAIEKQYTRSGQTELHILDGASFFGAHLLYTKTALGEVGSDFKWVLSTAGCTASGVPDQGPY